MPRVPTVRKADLDRALAALKAAGHQVARVEVKPGGDIIILTGEPLAANDLHAASPLDAWRERKRGPSAA